MIVSLSVQAQDIALVPPETDEGYTVMQAFTKRHSTRDYILNDMSKSIPHFHTTQPLPEGNLIEIRMETRLQEDNCSLHCNTDG